MQSNLAFPCIWKAACSTKLSICHANCKRRATWNQLLAKETEFMAAIRSRYGLISQPWLRKCTGGWKSHPQSASKNTSYRGGNLARVILWAATVKDAWTVGFQSNFLQSWWNPKTSTSVFQLSPFLSVSVCFLRPVVYKFSVVDCEASWQRRCLRGCPSQVSHDSHATHLGE